MNKDGSFSVFHIEGGLGKHVVSTAVARTIKTNYPERKLLVVCAWPEPYINLAYVDRVYRLGNTPYFYEDFIQGRDTIIFKQEPYFTTDHIHKRKHLIESWCALHDLHWQGEKPNLRFNLRQEQVGWRRWNRPKPIMVLHTNGGPLKEQPFPYSWTRDMPHNVTQELINVFGKDYHIIQICRDQNQGFRGVEVVCESMSNMELFYLLKIAKKRVLIDSCLQHAAEALNTPSTVLWVGTSPKTFGYDTHTNIIAKLPQNFKLPDAYLFDYDFFGKLHECPIMDATTMFDLEEIITSIQKQ